MKKLFYPFAFALTAFLFVYSCSTDEDDAPPPAAIVKKYTLAVTAGEGGTVSSSGGTYSQGTQVSITATPSSGFTFSQWSDGSTTNPITITLNSNTNLNAQFQAVVQYTLSAEVKDNMGGVLIIQSEEWYDFELNFNEGSEVNIVAIPEEGYEFVGWEGFDDNSAEITVIVDSITSIQAIFKRLPFASSSERYSPINETTGYFKESFYFKRYITLSEGRRLGRTPLRDIPMTYYFDNQWSLSYDFNDDGYLDLYFFAKVDYNKNLVNGKHSFISDFYNKTWGNEFAFPPETVIEADSNFSYPSFSEINDVDGDGRLEILSWTWEDHDRGNDTFGYNITQPEKGIIISSFDENFNLVYEKEVGVAKAFHQSASGDVDNDGDIDLLSFPTISRINQTVLQRNPTLLYNNGLGEFNEEFIFKDPTFVNNFYSFHATAFKLFDLDNDGFLDLIFAYDLGTLNTPPPPINGIEQFDFNDVYILWGDGSGKFSWDDKLVISIKNELNFQQVVLGMGFSDFDKDGDVDVFLSSTRTEETGSKDDFPATNYENYIINLLENKGNRKFEDETVNKIDGYFHINKEHAGDIADLFFIDKDLDGDFDLVPRDINMACCRGQDLNWADDLYWENIGGSFVRRIND